MSKPPDEEKLRNARALRLKERQMSAIIREISLHFMVVILVLFVAYANHDNKSFSFSNQATQLITKGSKSFDDVSTNTSLLKMPFCESSISCFENNENFSLDAVHYVVIFQERNVDRMLRRTHF